MTSVTDNFVIGLNGFYVRIKTNNSELTDKSYEYLIETIKQLPIGQLLYLHFDLVNFVKIMSINIESLSTYFYKLFGQNC